MIVSCPFCRTSMKIPDSAMGKAVACPQCKRTLVASSPPATVPPAPAPAVDDNPFAFDTLSPPPPQARSGGARGNPETDPFATEAPLDDRALQTASTHLFRFGQFLHRQQLLLSCGVGFSLIGILFLVLEILIVVTRGTEPLGAGGVIVFSLLGGGLLVLGLSLLGYCVVRFAAYPREVRVDPAGLTWKSGKGDIHVPWPRVQNVWRSEIVTMQGGKPMDWRSNTTVQADDGTTVTFDHSSTGYKELAAKIQAFTFPALLPKKREEWQAGRAEFGPVILSHDRVAIELGANDFFKKVSIPLEDLSRWGVRSGQLVFLVRGAKHELPLGKVPNYPVLLQLLEQATGTRPAPPALLDQGR